MEDIEKLLQSSGLSCDELLKKLQLYKSINKPDDDDINNKNENTSIDCSNNKCSENVRKDINDENNIEVNSEKIEKDIAVNEVIILEDNSSELCEITESDNLNNANEGLIEEEVMEENNEDNKSKLIKFDIIERESSGHSVDVLVEEEEVEEQFEDESIKIVPEAEKKDSCNSDTKTNEAPEVIPTPDCIQEKVINETNVSENIIELEDDKIISLSDDDDDFRLDLLSSREDSELEKSGNLSLEDNGVDNNSKVDPLDISKDCDPKENKKDSNIKVENITLQNNNSENDNSKLDQHNSREGCELEDEHNFHMDPLNSCEESEKAEIDLRNVLKMQLSSLRTKKKNAGLISNFKSSTPSSFENLTKKHKRKVADLSISSVLNEPNQSEENKEDLISLTNETEFVILNVIGGVELDDQVKSDENASVSEETKTNIEESNNSNAVEELAANQLNNCDLVEISSDSEDQLNSSDAPISTSSGLLNDSGKPKIKRINIKKQYTINSDNTSSELSKKEETYKSPFVSDKLEDFLSESSQLKISYPIPKLGAEEGLMETQKISPFDNLENKNSSRHTHTYKKHSSKKVVKAKTLAEMRRNLEKLQKVTKKKTIKLDNTITSETVQPISPIKLEDPPIKTESVVVINKVNDSEENENLKISNRHFASCLQRNCYVLYKNKKLWLPGKVQSQCVCTIPDDKKKQNFSITAPTPNRRLSLLSTLSPTNKIDKMTYKAGPLSKKVQLQSVHNGETWKTEIKSLPQVFLEVVPEIAKPMRPEILHLLPVFDNVFMTSDRVDFALSVLKSDPKPIPFKFPVSYKNDQKRIIVRKRIRPILKMPAVEETDSDIETNVKNVIDGLLNYVEIKEISDNLIKTDDDVEINIENEKILDNKGKKTITKRKRRLEMELERLNCKVINVVETENDADQNCTKLHCKMGCVCRSLTGDKWFSNHCGLVDCMFECKCPPSIKEASLTEFTMNHLNDQATKNLAKVEKEFTQTIIKTGSDMIMFGGKNKSKRISKVPKKFGEYMFDDIGLESQRKSIDENNVCVKDCTIDVVKLDLDQILPYCMLHGGHCCTCKLKGGPVRKYLNKRLIDSSQNDSTENKYFKKLINNTRKKRKLLVKNPLKCISDKSRPIDFEIKKENKLVVPSIVLKRSEKPVNQATEVAGTESTTKSDFSWSRQPTYKVKSTVISPAKLNKFNIQVINQVLEEEHKKTGASETCARLRHVFTAGDGDFKLGIKNDDINQLSVEKNENNVEIEHNREEQENNLLNNKANKRKQSFDRIRQDTNDAMAEFAIQRRKKLFALPAQISEKVFEGEIQVPLKGNTEISKLIGTKCENLEYFRILPWDMLIKGFNEHKIAIWSMVGRPKMLVCNKAGAIPPKNFICIRNCQIRKFRTGIIDWILTNKLPGNKSPQTTYLILVPTKNHYLIIGVCEKNQIKTSSVQNIDGDTLDSSTTLQTTTGSPNANKIYQTIKIHFKECQSRTWQIEDSSVTFNAQLPNIAVHTKWRMIYLKSGFTFLRFTKSRFSIKYTDLMDLVNRAHIAQKTLVMKNDQFIKDFIMPRFAIYCVPEYQDRFFVGPCALTETNGIETLRYMHRMLIDTNDFEKIQGINPVYKSVWVVQYLNESTSSVDYEKPNLTIENLLTPPFVKKLERQDIGYKEINRIFLCNIPNLGYLEGHQDGYKKVEVYWPDRSKGYEFNSVEFAKSCLIQYFSTYMYPIPTTFKINFVILTCLKVKSDYNPIDIKYLKENNGPFIVGDFGILHSEADEKNEIMKKYDVSSLCDVIDVEKHEDANVVSMVELFGDFLMSSVERQKYTTTKEILDWARSELYIMNRLASNYESEKLDLQNLYRFNALKVKTQLLSLSLPKKTAIIYNARLRRVLAQCRRNRKIVIPPALKRVKKTANVEVSETIEIDDSDEDEKNSQKSNAQKEDPEIQPETFKKLANVGTIMEPVFKPITKSGIIRHGSTSKEIDDSEIIQPGQSLLKSQHLSTTESRKGRPKVKVTNSAFKSFESKLVKIPRSMWLKVKSNVSI